MADADRTRLEVRTIAVSYRAALRKLPQGVDGNDGRRRARERALEMLRRVASALPRADADLRSFVAGVRDAIEVEEEEVAPPND